MKTEIKYKDVKRPVESVTITLTLSEFSGLCGYIKHYGSDRGLGPGILGQQLLALLKEIDER